MLQNRQTNTMSPLPTQMGQVGVMAMMMSIQKTEFCTDMGVPREPCVHPETELAGQTYFLAMFTCSHVSKSGFSRSHGSLLHIVCPCLSLVVGLDWGEWGWWSVWGGFRLGLPPTQHEVSGSVTPSATWNTGGYAHTRCGMWCGGLECMIHGMLKQKSARLRWSLTGSAVPVVPRVTIPTSLGCYVLFWWGVGSSTVLTSNIGQLQQDVTCSSSKTFWQIRLFTSSAKTTKHP